MAEDFAWADTLIVDNNSPRMDVSETNISFGSWDYTVKDEGRGALIETNIGNIHEEPGSAQASRQHQGNNRGRKRPRQGELSPIDKALNEIKNLNHCIDRRKKKLKELKSSWQLCIQHGKDKETQKAFCNRWAQRDDLMTLRQFDEELKLIRSRCRSKKGQSSTEEILELTKRLEIIRSTLDGILSKLNQETKEVDDLVESVTKEEIDTDSLRGKLQALSPWLFNKDQACPEQDNVEGDETVEVFMKTLNDYTTVNISEFESLEKDLETCRGWSIPKSLEPIANKIQLAYGKDATILELPCLVTICAAVREMSNVQQIEQLRKPKLLRWAGAINKGFEMGFKYEPAKRDLEHFAYAYYGSKPGVDEKLKTMENKKIQLEAQCEEVKKCVDAAQNFQGSLWLSNSLFN